MRRCTVAAALVTWLAACGEQLLEPTPPAAHATPTFEPVPVLDAGVDFELSVAVP